MDDKITPKQLKEAQEVIFKWFVEQNSKDLKKPITMLDTEISANDQMFRLITFMTFYGRNEIPAINLNEEV